MQDFLENDFEIVGKTLPGLEEIFLAEMIELGCIDPTIITRGVKFRGNKEILYKVNYQSRLALRFLVPIARFRALNENQLYSSIKKIHWHNYFSLKQTFAIDAITNHSNINHSKYAALKTKDAIADQFRNHFGRRPDVNTTDPDIRVNIHIIRDVCTVSLDSSGSSLHLRAYRSVSGTRSPE